MGMAASQARYLALTARKTNTEWEGQQINQARTALANQSANLFNRLLGLNVPTPPNKTDYTEIQYSYEDGSENGSVIDHWEQIGTPNSDYNYIVKHYYMANVLAGSQKQLQDPQVQLGEVLKKLDYSASDPQVIKNGDDIKVIYKLDGQAQEHDYENITAQKVADDPNLESQLRSFEEAMGFAKSDGSLQTDAVYGWYDEANGIWHFYVANETDYTKSAEDLRTQMFSIGLINEDGSLVSNNIYAKQNADGSYTFEVTDGYTELTSNDIKDAEAFRKAMKSFEEANNLLDEQGNLTYEDIYAYQSADGTWNFISTRGYTQAAQSTDENYNTQLRAYEESHGIIPVGGELVYDNIYGKQNGENWEFTNTIGYNNLPSDSTSLIQYETNNGLLHADGSLAYNNIYKANEGSEYKNTVDYTKISLNDTIPYMKPYDNIDYSTAYGPSYVGNCKLTELNKLVQNNDIDQVAELAQILKDCPTSNISKYLSFDTDGSLVYEGHGIYTFDLYGKTYYTTEADLYTSYNSATRADNTIDMQSKLNYYNAAVISKKIEEENKALLETDSKGRFTSVRFDNDSLKYQLKVEEKTNEAAYEDAHNKYLYEKAQYEKTIADINAKTSIIQKEDRTLELRLKQLDTEQNALATEMDAVKKVIKDNVEKTFKTFSD